MIARPGPGTRLSVGPGFGREWMEAAPHRLRANPGPCESRAVTDDMYDQGQSVRSRWAENWGGERKGKERG